MQRSSPPIVHRRFVVIGQQALASPDFSVLDLPSSSGRLDVLLRCLRSALLVSHGLRRDTTVYLVLLGGRRAPRTLRVRGETVRFLRPDERSLALMVQRALDRPAVGPGFVDVRPGVALAEGGLAQVLEELGQATYYVLDEAAPDLRAQALVGPAPVFFLGDHQGFDDATRTLFTQIHALPVSVGPRSLHSDDAITLTVNELDRREDHVTLARSLCSPDA